MLFMKKSCAAFWISGKKLADQVPERLRDQIVDLS